MNLFSALKRMFSISGNKGKMQLFDDGKDRNYYKKFKGAFGGVNNFGNKAIKKIQRHGGKALPLWWRNINATAGCIGKTTIISEKRDQRRFKLGQKYFLKWRKKTSEEMAGVK